MQSLNRNQFLRPYIFFFHHLSPMWPVALTLIEEEKLADTFADTV